MTYTHENRFRVYCGPTVVKTLAGMLRDKGLTITCEGTEHVYLTALCSDSLTLFPILQSVMSGFNLRDIHQF